MQSGKILVAQHDGTFVIKLVGDVRLTLCTTIDDYLNKMFVDPQFVGVLVDLTKAEGIDSTTLGLLAKLAVQGKQYSNIPPVIVSPNPDITRLLESMGFAHIFQIVDKPEQLIGDELAELPVLESDEEAVKQKIIEAHRILMDLNEKNRDTFSSLMKSLETS
jgi:anti-anti-sigma factor